MKIYCRKCGGLIVEDANITSVDTFKVLYGETCPHCGSRFSNTFRIHQTKEI